MNMHDSVKPYEGKDPFILISYDHKDSETVSVIISDLDKRGYRIWYHDRNQNGPEYIDAITQKIRNCRAFVCFLSANYDQSGNCLRELMYALQKSQTIVTIEPVGTIPAPAVNFQLRTARRFRLTEAGRDPGFVEKFCSLNEDIFEPCLRAAGSSKEEPEKKKSFLDFFRRKQ